MEFANRESRSSWRDFLLSLRKRGLSGVEFVVSDDHAGLKAAIREVLPEAVWQRCYVHFLRNALDYALGVLALLAVGLAIASLWLFLSAAYGRIRAVSAQSILQEGGDIRNVQLATTALNDLWWAQRLAISSAALLAAAIALSWYGPTAASMPPAFAKVLVRSADAPD